MDGPFVDKLPFFSLFQVKKKKKEKYSVPPLLFPFFFNRFLAGARGLPPYPLSLRCHSFVLTNAWCPVPDGSDWTQVDTQTSQAYTLAHLHSVVSAKGASSVLRTDRLLLETCGGSK